MANALNTDSIGIEISRKRCKKANLLSLVSKLPLVSPSLLCLSLSREARDDIKDCIRSAVAASVSSAVNTENYLFLSDEEGDNNNNVP